MLPKMASFRKFVLELNKFPELINYTFNFKLATLLKA